MFREECSLLDRLDSSYTVENHVDLSRAISEINRLFCNRRPMEMPHGDVIRLKYSMMHWRRSMKMRLLEHMPDDGDLGAWIESLTNLPIKFSDKECGKIFDHVGNGPLFEKVKGDLASFFATQAQLELYLRCGGKKAELCGPQVKFKMVANHRSKERLERWGKQFEFSHYHYEDGGVVYRGVKFLPGDVLLSSVNLGGNGCFTTFTEPRNYSFHSGFFCMIPCGAKLLPSVIESYELGVRAVPLYHFLSGVFNNYVEVIRCNDIKPDHYTGLARQALIQIERTKGYNFDTEDPDRTYLACPTVGTDLYESVGVARVKAISVVKNKQMASNLLSFGLLNHTLLFPVDYLLDPRFYCVGVIDNDAFETCAAQEVSDQIFKDVFCDGVVNFSKLPLFYHMIYFGVGQMKKKNLFGRILSFFAGFPGDSLPPSKNNNVIAMIENCGLYCARMERKLTKLVTGTIDFTIPFDIGRFCEFWKQDLGAKKIYKPLRKWFSLS